MQRAWILVFIIVIHNIHSQRDQKAERCNPIHEVRRQPLVKVHEYNIHGCLQTDSVQSALH